MKLGLSNSPIDGYELLPLIATDFLALFGGGKHRLGGFIILNKSLLLVDSLEVGMSITLGHMPVIQFFHI